MSRLVSIAACAATTILALSTTAGAQVPPGGMLPAPPSQPQVADVTVGQPVPMGQPVYAPAPAPAAPAMPAAPAPVAEVLTTSVPRANPVRIEVGVGGYSGGEDLEGLGETAGGFRLGLGYAFAPAFSAHVFLRGASLQGTGLVEGLSYTQADLGLALRLTAPVADAFTLSLEGSVARTSARIEAGSESADLEGSTTGLRFIAAARLGDNVWLQGALAGSRSKLDGATTSFSGVEFALVLAF